MKTENDDAQDFTTLDAYLAGFLTLQGFIPQLIKQGPKVVFLFHGTIELQESINAYHSGAEVEAIRLAIAIKALKCQIFSMKMDRGGH
jgi:hypothetical protein